MEFGIWISWSEPADGGRGDRATELQDCIVSHETKPSDQAQFSAADICRGDEFMNNEPIDNGVFTLLQHQRGGDCMSELSDKLRELTKTVRAIGRKGKLVLEIEVAPLSKGGGSAVAIIDRIKLSVPQLERETAVFYVNDDGSLSRNDPRQRELKFTEVTGGKSEVETRNAEQAAS